MEEVSGIPGGVPPLALYPGPSVKASLPTSEWEACLDSWLFSLEFRLRLQDKPFSEFQLSQDASGVKFLLSYCRSKSNSEPDVVSSETPKERILSKRAYLLMRRLLLVTNAPLDYGNDKLVDLLSLASAAFATVQDLKLMLKMTWKRHRAQMTHAIEEWKQTVSKDLAMHHESHVSIDKIHQMNSLVKASPDAGLVLMTGLDYLETLMEAYGRLQATFNTGSAQRVLTEHMFYCLRGLMADGSARGSLLLDHLYFMKSDAERIGKTKPNQPTLCSNLVCSTSFLRHLAADSSVSSGRGGVLLDFFKTYQQNTKHLHPLVIPKRRKAAKGKGRADPQGEMHIHKASQISQIHDLFPDLPNHYVLKLLDHFNDDTENVVAALLEPDALPVELRDHGTPGEPAVDLPGPAPDLAPRSTPPLPPQRKNVFDGDDFDKLRISADRLHRGRKEIESGEGNNEDEHNRRKAAIMSALATFDLDDDERDDTYDVADVGGTVDATLDTDERRGLGKNQEQNHHEETLFRAWRDNQELFARDSKTRISKVRQDLKRETGMSDEQIEGWAIMLKKDARLQDRLEKKYSANQRFGGNQAALASTRWQGDNTPDDSEEGENAGTGRRMGQAQIRGNRTWGRGGRGGGSTAGPSSDETTQAARRRKEQGRGRGGAAHGRREGRARKMARGMGGGTM